MYGCEPMETLKSWKKLAKALLNNTYQLAEKERKKSERIKTFVDRELMSLPAGKNAGARMMKCKTPYAQ